jgi:hypothetical protein
MHDAHDGPWLYHSFPIVHVGRLEPGDVNEDKIWFLIHARWRGNSGVGNFNVVVGSSVGMFWGVVVPASRFISYLGISRSVDGPSSFF